MKFGIDESPECGRIGELQAEMPIDEFALSVKEKLGSEFVHVSSLGDENVRRVAVIGGDGGDFIEAAHLAGADVLVTGETSYNDMIDGAECGVPVVAAGHYNTEAVVLPRLAKLAKSIAGAETEIFKYTTFKTI